MGWKHCLGRKCKSGWGYNESINQLISIKQKSPNIISETRNEWEYFVYDLSPNNIPYIVSFFFTD